jgi:hypothetical protein
MTSGGASRRVIGAARIGLRATMLLGLVCAGCVVAGGGGEVSYGYGVNYYEPFDNNGWYGPGYLVGPPRGGEVWRHDVPGRAYHGPSPDHAMPSIPHGERGGDHDQHH